MAAPAETLPQQQVSTTNWAPTAKVSVGILAASLTTLLLPLWTKVTKSNLDGPQAAAVTTMITFVIQYLVPERK